jgi:hypothetical protein
LKECPGLLGSKIAFKYFFSMAVENIGDAPYDVMANALARGAGVVPSSGTPGCDCVIPLVLESGALSFIYVQTKIGSSYKSHPSPADVLASSPENRFTFKDEEWPVAPYAYIYHHLSKAPLAKKIIKSPHHQPCLSLRGLREGSDLNSMREFLGALYEFKNEMLLCTRNSSVQNTWYIPPIDCVEEYDLASKRTIFP